MTSPAPSTVRGRVLQVLVGLVNRPARRRVQKRCALAVFKPDRIWDCVLALGAIQLMVIHNGAGQCVLITASMTRPFAERELPDTPLLVVPPFVLPLRPASIWSALKLRNSSTGCASPTWFVCAISAWASKTCSYIGLMSLSPSG